MTIAPNFFLFYYSEWVFTYFGSICELESLEVVASCLKGRSPNQLCYKTIINQFNLFGFSDQCYFTDACQITHFVSLRIQSHFYFKISHGSVIHDTGPGHIGKTVDDYIKGNYASFGSLNLNGLEI